jgi:glycosyltransferase involved in cell wall biosynthesis
MLIDSSLTGDNVPSEVSVIIATSKRPGVLTDTVSSLLSQTLPARKIIVIANEAADVETCIRDNPKVTVLFDGGSLTHKRNLALPYVEGKYVFFADDDIELHPSYISEAVLLLEDFPGIVGLSGKVLKDGRVTREEAKDLIRTTPEARHWKGQFRVRGRFKQLYGCNMVLRRSIIERETFDDELPGYSFGEDYDFWVRVRCYGITGVYDRCIAVHLQAAGGRYSPARVAYSHRLYVRRISVEILEGIDAWGDIEGWSGTSRLCARDRGYFDRTLATFARLGSLEGTRALHLVGQSRTDIR